MKLRRRSTRKGSYSTTCAAGGQRSFAGSGAEAYPSLVLVHAEPQLTSDDRFALEQAVGQFNRGRFFDCHETLEGVWLRHRGPSRDFFQALILVSVGFHHLERGNRVGALRTFAKARDRFEAYPASHLGFDVDRERARLETLLEALDAGMAERVAPAPSWRFDDLPLAADGSFDGVAKEDGRD